MKYAVFPPIGIARLGNSDGFFVGPEWPGGRGVEIAADGGETDVASFKDPQFRVKRQAARFRLFEFADDAAPGRPAQLPAGARIKWTVHLANKKSAIDRPPRPPDPATITFPLGTAFSDRLLDGGAREISGPSAGPVTFTPQSGPSGPHPDFLGEMRTDRQQQLMVLGGRGDSFGEPAQLLDFYTNDTWYDDVSDGPVAAEIVMADGTTNRDVSPAWVIVAPPDFAPAVPGLVTLYDLLFQVGLTHFGLKPPADLSFTRHIYPLVKRASDWQWVHASTVWSRFSTDFAALSASSCVSPAPALRTDTIKLLRKIQNNTTILDRFFLTDFQNGLIQSWEDGKVACDWQGVPAVDRTITPDGLTRAALDAGVGARLHPGIEAGAIMTRQEIYARPFGFRLSHSVLDAGDVTALMALPWQADFYLCRQVWWPSQRPDIVRPSTSPADQMSWAGGVPGMIDMVHNVRRLGVLRPKTNVQGEIIGMPEEGRDPSLPRPGH